MSYFVIGVGGTGAKLMQTLVHLAAAGLLPDASRELDGLLVDPDDSNGNVDECSQLARAYANCTRLHMGSTDLFTRRVSVKGPWTPVRTESVDTLDEIFQYTQRKESMPLESDLMELLFSKDEREMEIHQGFRGRPGIGATVLGNTIDFSNQRDVWFQLLEKAKAAGSASGGVPVLLAGSVFGGSGAAGVPTILQLMEEPLSSSVNRLRLGLILFLPYFRFSQIPGQKVQADPNAFPLATVEALKYYDERGFLKRCHSIFTVGEKNPAEMAVSSVGSATQRNEPHFVELVAGMGAVQFLGAPPAADAANTVSIAGRRSEDVLTWDDLPISEALRDLYGRKLRRMIEFAVAFRLSFYSRLTDELRQGRTKLPILVELVERERVPKETVLQELDEVRDYVNRFLLWLLRVSKPRGGTCQPALVDVTVFAEFDKAKNDWVLRSGFRKPKDFRDLFAGFRANQNPDLDGMWKRVQQGTVSDNNAKGTGRLIRAIYDACAS